MIRETKMSVWAKALISLVFVSAVTAMIFINIEARGTYEFWLGVYGTFMISYLLIKMGLSFLYKPFTDEIKVDYKVTVVIPSYNEKPEAVRGTIESILSQDYPIHEIFLVDDGSKDQSGYWAMKELESSMQEAAATGKGSSVRLVVHRLPKNSGKRHAQAWAFKRATGDIIVTIDSDGYLYPNAVRELLRPFSDLEVMATTGHVNARNREDNLLTRLIDMRYDNAFRVERAAQSVTGNLLVCSGPLSAYRKKVVLDNLERYTTQTFLGEPVQFGDDRCLTNYAIERGKTVYQSTAKCITDVPDNLRQFIKQQIRWNKSFFRESLIALKIGVKKPVTLIWTISEMSLWILFGISMIISVVAAVETMAYIMVVYYMGYIALSAYARNVFFIVKHPLTFLLAPVYGIIHITLLFPLRIYALLTIRKTKWGTR